MAYLVRPTNKTTWDMTTWGAIAARVTYDSDTGLFTRISTGKTIPVGHTTPDDPYAKIEFMLNGHRFVTTQHRLAWFLVHKSVPPVLDHINGNHVDNRLCNLRAASYSLNGYNRHKKKGMDKTLPIGIYMRSDYTAFVASASLHGVSFRKTCSSIEAAKSFLADKRALLESSAKAQ